jgi:hypothetical protein
MSRGVAGLGLGGAGGADVTDGWKAGCGEGMSHLDDSCLATFSDTFATECDWNSLNFT